MNAISDQRARPTFFASLARGLRLRCPCCGLGALFRAPFRMYHDCPVCGLDYFREPGYYVGAMIINYGATSFLMLIAYLIVAFLVPPIWNAPPETKIPIWMAAAIVVSLALFHHCRAIWLAVDYWLEPWQPGDPLLREPSTNP
ncbi:MAG TPA: DUF983 domain-containing protein [Candidatus Acidoferrales bacterium]|jgi:uncharacterized protein (DUF983 family)|nr:DUF983 domain-containing protein [Candidatus Acidoferrales bacterium]